MNGNTQPDLGRQESIAQTPHVTAAIRRSANGEIVTEYEHNGRVYTDLKALERALGGIQR